MIGRKNELATLERIYSSGKAEFVAVYLAFEEDYAGCEAYFE